MKSLVLTADATGAGCVISANCADLAVAIELRLVWGPPRSDAELAGFWAPRTDQKPGAHWLDSMPLPRQRKFGITGLGLVEAFQRFETVELWMGPDPNAQLTLIWLLQHLGPQAKTIGVVLRHVDVLLGETEPRRLARLKFPAVAIGDHHLGIARQAWQAFRSPTPHAWFDLLGSNLSILPQLRRCVLEMLEELPGRASGLGASELRMLELISASYEQPFDLFPHFRERFQRRVFGYWEAGAILETLALAQVPAISGLAEWPFTLEMHNEAERYERYKQGRLSLTPLGEAILAGTEDFSRHNPIDRWWGGTHLTNDRLWRWDPVLLVP
jgi:hypothetical protein